MKKGRHNQSQKISGFTLVELILYLGLMSLLVGTVIAFWWTINDLNNRGQAMESVTAEAQYISEVVTMSVSNATAITVPAAGANGAGLTVTVTSAPLSPTVFALSSGNLTMQEGSNSAVNLNSSRVIISGLTFSNTTNTGSTGAVRMQYTVSYNNTSGRSDLNYSQTYYVTAAIR